MHLEHHTYRKNRMDLRKIKAVREAAVEMQGNQVHSSTFKRVERSGEIRE